MRARSFDETGSSHSCSPSDKKRSSSYAEHDRVDSPLSSKAAAGHCSVTSVYQANLAGIPRKVTIVWSKNLINHSLFVSIESTDEPLLGAVTCKVELKPWPFWSKKGHKPLEIDGWRVDVYWDLRSAKFSGGPEPSSGFYVALVCCEEVVLLLGDCKKEAYKRTKSRPTLTDAALVCKRENVYGRKCFSARARFDEKGKEHDIVIENSLCDPRADPEMWISVDGIVLVHVSNLQWKFRGNQTVRIGQVAVQVLWDVHDWMFAVPGTGHGLFIFRPTEWEQQTFLYEDERQGAEDTATDQGRGKDARSGSHKDAKPGLHKQEGSSSSSLSVHDFSFFLYAWKVE